MSCKFFIAHFDGYCHGFRLPNGCDNTMFHYVQLDSMEGMYICPTQQETSQVATPTHVQLLNNFQQACLVIQQVLQQTQKTQVSWNNSHQHQYRIAKWEYSEA